MHPDVRTAYLGDYADAYDGDAAGEVRDA
ncbi:hypothetical protein [Pandoraea fibrosis]